MPCISRRRAAAGRRVRLARPAGVASPKAAFAAQHRDIHGACSGDRSIRSFELPNAAHPQTLIGENLCQCRHFYSV